MGYGCGAGSWWPGVVVLALVLGIVALINYLHISSEPNGRYDNNALNILNERYARGEITEEE